MDIVFKTNKIKTMLKRRKNKKMVALLPGLKSEEIYVDWDLSGKAVLFFRFLCENDRPSGYIAHAIEN